MDQASRQRYERLKNTEEERNKLIEELFVANDDLKSELDRVKQRLERDNDTVDMYQHRAKEANLRLEALQKLSDSSTYICVLIDGEDFSFNDEFIHGAASEGQNAARLLRGAIEQYVGKLEIRQDCDIVVYIYANVYTLAKKFRDFQGDIDRFISGFNNSYLLFNFIDGGNGPGNVKSKIGEQFRLHIKNLHCKHMILGISTGDAYASFLEAYDREKNSEKQVTLLKGPPFSQELSRLSSHFKNTAFPQVFRAARTQHSNGSPQNYQKSLPRAEVANHQAPEDRFLDSLDDDRRRHSTNGAANYGVGEQRVIVDNERRSSLRDSASSRLHRDDDPRATGRRPEPAKVAYPPAYFLDAPFGFVARNRKGQRVDVPLSKPDSGRIYDIKKSKLCNDYVFRKKCNNNPCRHQHPSNLSEEDMHTLRDVARSFPCPDGLRCNDTLCHAGHRCPVDPCGFVQDRNCRYPPELHETDTAIVNIEDFKRFQSNSYDETRILGVTSRPKRDSASSATVSRNGEPLFRNLSMAFDNSGKNGSKDIDISPQATSTSLGKSILTLPTKVSTSAPAPGAAATPGPISPLKRTADEANEVNEASHESRSPPAATRDPRVGAQKRLRGLSPRIKSENDPGRYGSR